MLCLAGDSIVPQLHTVCCYSAQGNNLDFQKFGLASLAQMRQRDFVFVDCKCVFCTWSTTSASTADISRQDAQEIVRVAKGNVKVPFCIQKAWYTICAFLWKFAGMVYCCVQACFDCCLCLSNYIHRIGSRFSSIFDVLDDSFEVD